MKKRIFTKLLIFLLVFIQASYLFLVKAPPIETASLTSASDTLSNSRLSYRAGVATGASASSTVTIDGSANADNDTNHLFPSDVVCFAGATLNGCSGQTTYTVANIIDSTTFNITSPLSAALGANDFAIATQSATHTIVFTTVNTVPTTGDILLTIPAVNVTGKTNDGFPDTSTTAATNGFDLNSLATGNVSVSSSGCANNWTVAAVTAGDATNDHTIRIDRSTNSCAAGSIITVTVGDGTTRLINPAPISTGHTQGTADVYSIAIETRDGSDNTLDDVSVKVAPIEAVLVSATVDQSLSFTVAGVSSGASTCGQTTDVTTTAYSVPWGTIATPNSFLEGSQLLTVSTNAPSGYSVKIEENDQMGKNGITCTGASAGAANSCIPDTTCNGAACSESTSAEWTTASNNGLGFSLANSSGTDASFLYNESSRTFSSRQIADQEATETKANIMSNASPVSGSAVHVCYRISVSGVQPAGYYYNKVKYTATAVF